MADDFDPDNWEKSIVTNYPQLKRNVQKIRQTMDITQNEQIMSSVLDSLRQNPPELYDRLMQLEAQAMDITMDDDNQNLTEKNGKPIRASRERMLRKRVEKLMVVRNPQLYQFPEYARKAILERA